MMQNELLTKNLATVGEAISHDLGAKMVKDFQDAHADDVKSYYIGKNIIESILAQPGCVGIRFYNALNEAGKKTLVYVGIDANENIIAEYTCINNLGEIVKEKAIVADRVKTADDNDTTSWNWWVS